MLCTFVLAVVVVIGVAVVAIAAGVNNLSSHMTSCWSMVEVDEVGEGCCFEYCMVIQRVTITLYIQ